MFGMSIFKIRYICFQLHNLFTEASLSYYSNRIIQVSPSCWLLDQYSSAQVPISYRGVLSVVTTGLLTRYMCQLTVPARGRGQLNNELCCNFQVHLGGGGGCDPPPPRSHNWCFRWQWRRVQALGSLLSLLTSSKFELNKTTSLQIKLRSLVVYLQNSILFHISQYVLF